MPGMSGREYADHRGVSHTAVQRAIAAGRITLLPDGTIDPAVADRQWATSTDPTKAMNAGNGIPAGEDASRLASSFGASHAAREGYLARKAKLEYEKMSGKLVDADEVRASMFAIGRRLRDGFMGIPDRITPRLVGQADPALIHRLLTEEITAALSELPGAVASNSATKSSR